MTIQPRRSAVLSGMSSKGNPKPVSITMKAFALGSVWHQPGMISKPLTKNIHNPTPPMRVARIINDPWPNILFLKASWAIVIAIAKCARVKVILIW